MSNLRYSNKSRLALAIKRDAALVAKRSVMTEAEIAEAVGVVAGDEVSLTVRVYAWPDFVAAYRAGDTMNAHRSIIERDGAAH